MSAGIQIALRRNVQSGSKRKKGGKKKENNKKGKGEEKKKSLLLACLDGEEAGPGNVEIPESGANSACIHINMAKVLGGNGWGERIGERNVLAFSTHDLMGGYVVSLV